MYIGGKHKFFREIGVFQNQQWKTLWWQWHVDIRRVKEILLRDLETYNTLKEKDCLLVATRGVFVSLKPRKTPCIANERRTAGAPNDLTVKYLRAGFSIGEFYKDILSYNSIVTSTKWQNLIQFKMKILWRKTKTKLTGSTPMYVNIGLAAQTRITAWIRPRAAPITNADEADDTCRFLIPEPIISLCSVQQRRRTISSNTKLPFFFRVLSSKICIACFWNQLFLFTIWRRLLFLYYFNLPIFDL